MWNGARTWPKDMVYVPTGWFLMGDSSDSAEGGADELPVHRVHVRGFFLDRYEVSKKLWDKVHDWAVNNGYIFRYSGGGKAPDHPVHSVNWYDCIKWANARSQMQGLQPVYFSSRRPDVVYRQAEIDIDGSDVDWSANGYRLPTEAEWEKAARGGVRGHRFPWTDDTISHGRANYYAAAWSPSFDLSAGAGYPPAFVGETVPHTSPVGLFAPNGFGLYDMAGNVREWCWDAYAADYYEHALAADPRGPVPRGSRVLRGGSWDGIAYSARCADRNFGSSESEDNDIGFRCARGH